MKDHNYDYGCTAQAPSQTDAEAGGRDSDGGQASVVRRASRPKALPNGVVGFDTDAKVHRTGADAAAHGNAEEEAAPAHAESHAEGAAEIERAADSTPRLAVAAPAQDLPVAAAGAGLGNSNTPFDDIPSLLRSAPSKRPDVTGGDDRTLSRFASAAPVFGTGGTPGADLPVTFGTRRLRFADQATPQLLRGSRGDRPVAGRNSTPYLAAAIGARNGGGASFTPLTAGLRQAGGQRDAGGTEQRPFTAPSSRGQLSAGPAAAMVAGGTPFSVGGASRLTRCVRREQHSCYAPLMVAVCSACCATLWSCLA